MDLGMTKEQYFEMCEVLNSVPKDSEIPVEYTDLPIEVQEAVNVYSMLSDSWDYMNGRYIGKNYAGFSEICDMLNLEDKESKKFTYEITRKIDEIRKKIINKKTKDTTKKPPK